MAKKYMSVFNDGTQDLTIKDAEAQETLASIPSTYATKSELSTLEQKMEGPYLDEEHRCIVFPDYENAYYDPASKGIII